VNRGLQGQEFSVERKLQLVGATKRARSYPARFSHNSERVRISACNENHYVRAVVGAGARRAGELFQLEARLNGQTREVKDPPLAGRRAWRSSNESLNLSFVGCYASKSED